MPHLGLKVLDQFIENMPEHRAAINDMDIPHATELKAEAWEMDGISSTEEQRPIEVRKSIEWTYLPILDG